MPFIVMEYCLGGTLQEHLQRSKRITLVDRVQFLFEVSSGMRYLHKMEVVHRDLAARNVLIAGNGTLRISDFGLSRSPRVVDVLESGRQQASAPFRPLTFSLQIPVRSMAPESLTRTAVFTAKSDVWAFGM